MLNERSPEALTVLMFARDAENQGKNIGCWFSASLDSSSVVKYRRWGRDKGGAQACSIALGLVFYRNTYRHNRLRAPALGGGICGTL